MPWTSPTANSNTKSAPTCTLEKTALTLALLMAGGTSLMIQMMSGSLQNMSSEDGRFATKKQMVIRATSMSKRIGWDQVSAITTLNAGAYAHALNRACVQAKPGA